MTAVGRRAYALARPEWATQRPLPPFVTWLVLATHADPAVRTRQLARRQAFLEAEATRERATLAAILAGTGPTATVAARVVSLTIRQFEAELAWLDEVAAALPESTRNPTDETPFRRRLPRPHHQPCRGRLGSQRDGPRS